VRAPAPRLRKRGRALIDETPTRVAFSWNLRLQWRLESDPQKTSEVEVRFTEQDADRTRVDPEHRNINIDRHGDGWGQMRDAVGSLDGWGLGLRRFAEAASKGNEVQ
jgi:hypothetical protein